MCYDKDKSCMLCKYRHFKLRTAMISKGVAFQPFCIKKDRLLLDSTVQSCDDFIRSRD